jgi:peptide/nickel transport system substrate-binding protein
MNCLNKNSIIWLLVLAWITALPACSPPVENKVDGKPSSAASSSDEKEPEVLLEPFDPPTLAELDAKADWQDRPVLDSIAMLRELQAGEKPLVTVDEALKMVNDSPEANAKILSALGRLPASDDDADWEATINRHIGGEARSTNPIMSSSTIESDINGLCGFGLFSFDWNMRPFASKDSVVSWQTSKDQMYDKVVIRDDLTWSDGKPITAHDVVFSYRTIMNPNVPVPAVRSGTDKLRWVEAYDDHTLVYFHRESMAVNVWNINFPVIPKHIYEESLAEDYTLQNSPYHVKYENNPISGGAYQIVERKRGQEVLLERRESYYMFNGKQVRDKPFFKTIRFRIIEDSNTALLALKSGNIEEMILSPEQWTTQATQSEFYERNTKASGVEWVSFHFCWNAKTPFFDDVRVRKAMSYAFDHNEMLSKLCYGLYEPCNGVFHHTSQWYPKDGGEPYKQDLDKAEELLDEAGWEDHDGDGIRDKEIDGRQVNFEFTILCSNSAERIAVCNLLKQNLDQIGVVCHVRPLEFSVLMEKTQKKEFQAHYSGWGTGTDPYTLENIFKTGEERNYGSYSNKRVDELFAQGLVEFDEAKRQQIYQEIHKILYDEQPYTWLYYRNSFYGFNKELRGYKFSPRGPFNYSPGFGSIWKVVP